MNGTAVYEETSVTTQSQGRLIVMLYEGAVKFLRQGQQAMQRGDNEARSRCIVRAQDIIFELNSALDMEVGGEIAVNLRKLYNFMWQRLSEANMQQSSEMLDEVIGLLEELNTGWRAVAQ